MVFMETYRRRPRAVRARAVQLTVALMALIAAADLVLYLLLY